MIGDVENLVDRYWCWVKDNTVLRRMEDYVEITTPFLDIHNDLIQIYVRREGDMYLLTDAGYTIDDLAMSGCPLDTPKRRELLAVTLAGFGVKDDRGEILVRVTRENFSFGKHRLIQSILSVNDLFYLARTRKSARPHTESVFRGNVAEWLDGIGIEYKRKITFSGKSGGDCVFDFKILHPKSKSDKIIHTLSRPTKDKTRLLAFSWLDIRESESMNLDAYAILNDANGDFHDAMEILGTYDISPVRWSGRDEIREKLAA